MSRMTRNYTFVDYATQSYQLLVVFLILFFHNGTVAAWPWRLSAHIVASILTQWLIERHASGKGCKVVGFLRHFYPVLFYTWFFTETGALNRMFLTQYLDPELIQWEQRIFGFQPSVVFMQKLPWLLVSEILYASYFSYYVMITGIGIALYLRNRTEFFHYVSVISFIFYVCYTIYIFLPVIGPRVFFRDVHGYELPQAFQELVGNPVFPEAVKHGIFFKLMAWIYQTFEAPGAAMPSSHVAIAVSTVFFSAKYLPKIWRVHAVVAFLLCLSTVYCRYHYLIDVAGGLLTAAILVPLGNCLYSRFRKPELEHHAQPPLSRPSVAGAGTGARS